jgi:demethylmenaquinone methyltransferase/2-methoxy-6-polyprenyl-1,4-benzoquinol methylase
MGDAVSQSVLADMVDYYRARAAEYDEWWERTGRYDQGLESNARWFSEMREVFTAFDALDLRGDVLELAPGTGIWTERLIRTAETITAVDASEEMIAMNRAKVGGDRVTYVIADLFTWQPDRQYDGVCFGFWISHVPADRLNDFLCTVAAALKPGGRVFFVDGRREPTTTAKNHVLPHIGEQVMTRKLNDGRSYQIVKNFYAPAALAARCRDVGLDMDVRETATNFIYGVGTRR